MNVIRLYNDNAGETRNELGAEIQDTFGRYIRPIIKEAATNGLCLRDLESLLTDEIRVTIAEETLRRAIKLRKN
jgi:hypothetical protein